MKNRGIAIELSTWKVLFKDGFKIEFIDASRQEIINYLGESTKYDKHGYIKKITKIK